MTVQDVTSRTSAVGTNTAGQEVAFTFPINATSDLVVKTRLTSSGAESALTETTDYTVLINGDAGGVVTMVSAIATTYEIHIRRDTPSTQALDLEQGGSFSAENIEEALDKLTRRVNDHDDDLLRCIRAPATDATGLDMGIDDSVARASAYLTFDSNGDPTVTTTVAAGSVTFGAFGTSVAATATEAAFKTLANLESGTDVQAWDAQLDDIAALVPTDSYFIVGDGTNWVRETAGTVLTSLGITAYMQTLLDDTTSADARATLEVDTSLDADDIVVWEDAVLSSDGNILTWKV